MMSSEEETEFGLYADKLLKKAKRTRQRVDAGEPRNSYSSIPNFSSRPSFLGGNNNLYGAIFTQQQHFGLFGPGFGGPGAKMLNELLAGRQKADGGGSAAAAAADSGDEVVKYECNAASRCGDGGVVSPPPGVELAAHHMLRDILQGRKHELLGLAAEHASADNLVNNNNNNNNNNETIKAQQRTEREQLQQTTQTQQPPSSQQQANNTTAMTTTASARDQVGGGDSESREASREREQPRSGSSSTANDSGAEQAALLDDREVGDGSTGSLGGGRQAADLMDEALTGMDTDSLPSPKLEPASPAKPEDAKKARVENIVSGMRSSPAPPQVNGCKKRKLYQPQQHDSAADRYIDEEDDELEPIRQQKRIEKNALKSQLRTMQEQLAEMQQKYVQLCTRMEQESNCEEVEEMPSDSEDTVKRSTPAGSPISREPPTAPSSAPPVSLAQQVSKLKIGPPHHVPAHFNGMLHDHHHHPHMSNAAAMYLGVSHKLFLEQEARMAKEAAVAAAVAESQHHHQQQQQAAQQQAQQHAAAAAAAQQHAAQQHAAAQQQQQQQQAQQAAQQHHQQQQAAQHAAQHQQQTPPSASLPCKPDNIAERLNMIRNMTPTGSELEGLADALKSEITASLSNIIDAIVTRFVHQRRLKQSEASAAAEQLNKDLMLASQMLDRKSPRIKLADSRQSSGPQVNGSTPMMNGGSSYPPMMSGSAAAAAAMQHMNNMQKAAAAGELHSRQPMFQPPKPPGLGSVPMYPGMGQHPFCAPERDNPEQNEALSLVVTPKKKRHKVTDTRITPRTVSRILAQDGMGMSPAAVEHNSCPSPRPYHQPPPPPMLPVSLPTSVAIPNPGLHESQVFSPYSPFFHGPSHGHHIPMQVSHHSAP